MIFKCNALWWCTLNVCMALIWPWQQTMCCHPNGRASVFLMFWVHAVAVHKAWCQHQCILTKDYVCLFMPAVSPLDCLCGLQGYICVYRNHIFIRLLRTAAIPMPEAATFGRAARWRHSVQHVCVRLHVGADGHQYALFRIWIASYGQLWCISHILGIVSLVKLSMTFLDSQMYISGVLLCLPTLRNRVFVLHNDILSVGSSRHVGSNPMHTMRSLSGRSLTGGCCSCSLQSCNMHHVLFQFN